MLEKNQSKRTRKLNEKNRKKRGEKKSKCDVLIQGFDFFICGVQNQILGYKIFRENSLSMVLMKESKANSCWCDCSSRRNSAAHLEEKNAALHRLGRILIIFRVDHHWRTSTLEYHGDNHFIIFLILESISF